MLRGRGYSPNTIRDRRRCLRRLHEDLPYGILAACREQITAWLSYDQWSPATRYTYTGHVCEFYAWLASAGLLPTGNPANGIRRPRVPKRIRRPASEEQLAVALSAPEPLRTAVLLAAFGGLRRAEAASCCREHITQETIVIPRAKGGDAQTVPCHPAIWEHVRDRVPGPIVPDLTGAPIDVEHLGAIAARWFDRNGLPGIRLHDLRRRFGAQVQRTYRNIRVTQRLLRHSSIATTQLYTFVEEDEARAALLALPLVGEFGPAVTRPERPNAA